MPYALVIALSSGIAMAVLIAVGLGLGLVIISHFQKKALDRREAGWRNPKGDSHDHL
jgi:uncharacterized protein HemX